MKAIKNNGISAIINIEKLGANNAGVKDYTRDFLYKPLIRQ